jgi:hypothetical protein
MSKYPGTVGDIAAASPSSGMRGAVDSLVLSSLVELFAAYEVAVAPLPRIARELARIVPDVSAVVGFMRQRGNQPGRMTLSVPSLVLGLMKSGTENALKGDWARELANQLMGRLKNRLLLFGVRLQMGISSGVDSEGVVRQLQLPSTRVYAGRTLRGEILVTLEGMPNDAELTYVGPIKVPAEGDVILF